MEGFGKDEKMIQKVKVITSVGPDIKGEGILHDIKTMPGLKNISKVSAIKVYRLEGINTKNAKILAEKLLSEPINQIFTINQPISYLRGEISIEIAYRPGVMNPEVVSITKAAEDLKIKLLACDSSWEYLFFGNLTKADVVAIVEKLNLYNKLTEHIVGKDPQTLLIKDTPGKTRTISVRQVSDNELLEFSKDKLFLNLEEMKAIQKYFQNLKRDPTDLELETIAQTWSEHSGHKTFKSEIIVDGKKKKPLIERIKKEAFKHNKNIVSAFVDNSGVMEFYGGFAICGKGETHNAPSAIEPYGGAMTGSGGVFRDVAATGQGAKNIASTDIFCFAPPDYPANKLPEGTLPPGYLLKRVVAGVRDYGNRMGIPTNNGSVHFHPDFRTRPTVFVGAYGITPKKYAKKGIPKLGDLILVVGGRTGRDGIHGATFSSGIMSERTISVNSSAVQIGNAIEEKRMFDALIEARNQDLIRAIQDCGGGGFSSSVGEVGEDLGVTINLEKASLKYQGLAPWEIWVSESQERMILVIPPKNLEKLLVICKKYNVEASVLGRFDGSKKLNVFLGKEKVGNLDMKFLHHGLPQRVLQAKRQFKAQSSKFKAPKIPKSEKEWIKVLEKVLAHGNVCSKEPIIRPYDHSVGGTNDLQPYSGVLGDGPNDAVVLRPLLDKPYGVVIAHGLNPILNKLDPYWGSMWAGVEALSNFVAVGGDCKNASLINNYIWPFPDEESLWSLDRSVDAVVDFMKVFKIPVISGKDSLSSTYRGKDGQIIKIPPVLCMSVFGKIPDTSKTASADFKKTNSVICLVGQLDDSLGGSVYYQVNNLDGNSIPKVDLASLPKVFTLINKAITTGKALSVHDVSEGGVISAVFEMCVGGKCGAMVSLKPDELFNETAGCFVVEVENESVAKKLFKGLPYQILGKTQSKSTIEVKSLFSANVESLKKVWQEPMRRMFA